MSMSRTDMIDFRGHTFEITYTFTKGSPGRYSGPPEDCYPAEESEVEISDIKWAPDPASPIRIHIYDLLVDILQADWDALYDTVLEFAEESAAEDEIEYYERSRINRDYEDVE